MGRLFVLLVVFALKSVAAPGFVTTTLTPPGPIPVNEMFTVTFRLFDYTDAAEIDGFRFTVQWPSELFALVANTFNLGESEGPNQQWLAKPNQESLFNGYALASFSESTGSGSIKVDLRDTGSSANESGTLANTGFLFSFQLRALAEGTGLIRAAAYNGATGQETFYGTAGTVLGVPQFSASSQTVLPTARLFIGRSQTDLIVSWATNASEYRLQSRSGLGLNTSWNNFLGNVTTSNGLYYARVPRGANQLFFRLTRD